MYLFDKETLMTTEDVVFRAIAHPARRAMLSLLAASDCSVKELTTQFRMSQPAISQHLKELREAKLVASDRVGLEQRYRLTPKPLKLVVEWSAQYRTLIDPAGHAWSIQLAADQRSNKGPAAEARRRRDHGR